MFCMFTIVTCMSAAVLASDDEYSLTVQDKFLRRQSASRNLLDIGACAPNEDLTGIVCDNITGLDSHVFDRILSVRMDINTTAEPSEDNNTSYEFVSRVQAYVTFADVVDSKVLDFTFSSSTPNGTVLSSGNDNIGRFDVKTGNVFFPLVTTDVNVSHTVVLIRDDNADMSCTGNSSTCDRGTLVTTVGIRSVGNKTDTAVDILLRVDEPEVATALIPFRHEIDGPQLCNDLAYNLTFKGQVGVDVNVCVPGLPCFNDRRYVDVGQQGDSKVLADNVCFEHSLNVTT
jgi:hypothetical protein